MSMILKCVVCDDKIPNQYGGDACCGGTRCARYEMTEQERADLEPKELPNGGFMVAA